MFRFCHHNLVLKQCSLAVTNQCMESTVSTISLRNSTIMLTNQKHQCLEYGLTHWALLKASLALYPWAYIKKVNFAHPIIKGRILENPWCLWAYSVTQMSQVKIPCGICVICVDCSPNSTQTKFVLTLLVKAWTECSNTKLRWHGSSFATNVFNDFSFVLASWAARCQKFDITDLSLAFLSCLLDLPYLVNHYPFTKISETE